MKTIGSIIIVIGLIMTLGTSVYPDAADGTMNTGDMEGSIRSQQNPDSARYEWIGVMVIGGAVLMLGRKKYPNF